MRSTTTISRKNRLAAPLLHAFRDAFETRSSKRSAAAAGADGDRVEPRSSARRAITEHQLRREVTRDVVSLLNTVNMGSTEDLDAFPAVAASILNYGLPDLSTRTIDEHDVHEIAREIERALRDFEPRLVSGTLSSERDMSVAAEELKIRFVIRADLLCNPVNVPVEFTADVEIDTGKIRIDRL